MAQRHKIAYENVKGQYFEHEDMEAGTRYYSAPGVEMGRRVAIDIFFDAADRLIPESPSIM